MNQKKIGSFLKELRKEMGITQEEFAEKLDVSSRTISRWETGANMPDISLLVNIAEIFNVSIPEIINGERKSENMNREEKDTLLKVADYAENEKDILMKRVRIISCVGFGALLLALLFESFGIGQINPFLMSIESIGFGLAVGALLTSIFFTTGILLKMKQNPKIRKISKIILAFCIVIVMVNIIFCFIQSF